MGKDPAANPLREEFVAAPLDAESRAARILVRGQRQGHPAAIVEPVEPEVDGSRHAGVDVDHIGRIELDLGTVALHGTHIRLAGEIHRKPFGEAGIVLDRRGPPAAPAMCAMIAV